MDCEGCELDAFPFFFHDPAQPPLIQYSPTPPLSSSPAWPARFCGGEVRSVSGRQVLVEVHPGYPWRARSEGISGAEALARHMSARCGLRAQLPGYTRCMQRPELTR